MSEPLRASSTAAAARAARAARADMLEAGRDEETGTRSVPGAWLETLAVKMKLTSVEWRVVAFVLARGPVTAWRLAKELRLKYPHAKRAARELVRWRILSPSPEGLRFQPPPAQWEPPVVPAPAPDGHGKPPKKPDAPAAQEPEEEEEVLLRW